MEQFQHDQSSSIATHAQPARTAVHPGWFSTERVVTEVVEDPVIEDETRFAALSQLLRTAGALDRAASDTLADLGLTAGAFFALLELSDASPVGLAPSELSRRLAVARRTATLYVDILTRQGWVERNAHPDDRRMVLARLTPGGESLVNDLATAYKRRLAGLIQEMSPLQAERLRQLLKLVPVGPQLDLECDR